MNYAGFWRRLAAYLIDAVVLTIGATLLVMPLLAAGVPLLGTMDRQGLVKGWSRGCRPMPGTRST
jgi:uncharacterized RDD family membrane protein YckC